MGNELQKRRNKFKKKEKQTKNKLSYGCLKMKHFFLLQTREKIFIVIQFIFIAKRDEQTKTNLCCLPLFFSTKQVIFNK